MALVDSDLFGNVRDKVKTAIEIARTFEPKEEPYIFADSGGKDSAVTRKILDMAGVKYQAVYNLTTVDPPELVRHIITQYDGVVYDMPDGTHKYFKTNGYRLVKVEKEDMPENVIHFTIPKKNMRQLIILNVYPPTRLARYCCEELKETTYPNRLTVTGARRCESVNRKQNSGEVVIFDAKQVETFADEYDVDITTTKLGGAVLNYDDSGTRRIVEQCYRTSKTLINPISDFTDGDVWDFIRQYNVPYCKLYDEGFKRMGCIGCPMGRKRVQEQQFRRWPHMRRYYISAFSEMLRIRKDKGLGNRMNWNTGEDVFRWWLGYDKKWHPDQMSIDELEE